MGPKDFQRTKLHNAIEAALRLDPLMAEKCDPLSALDFIYTGVLKQPWFKEMYSNFYFNEPVVGFAKRQYEAKARCKYLYGNQYRVELEIPGWARNRIFILRFLAFTLAPKSSTWSGPETCAVLIFLTKNVLGEHAVGTLVQKFVEHNVKFKPYPQLYTVEEQLQTMQVQFRVSGKGYFGVKPSQVY